MRHAFPLAAFLVALSAPWAGRGAVRSPTPQATDPRVVDRLMTLTRDAAWRPVAAIRLPFRTFHPQGMVKVGPDFYLSSVEVREQPKAGAAGHDRGPGAGVGHLFKFGSDGALLAQLTLGEGSIYHPGGLDFDGRFIWAPVSEYRPDSRAIVYRIDPLAMKATEVFRFDDHIGAVASDRRLRRLHGFSWGSRRIYLWRIEERGSRVRAASASAPRTTVNRLHYIDYQDCHYAGPGRMLCGGLAELAAEGGSGRFELGGLELVDLSDDRPVWQAPVSLRSPTGRPMTQNPVFVEATVTGLRAYFVPDDDDSTLYIYDVDPGASSTRPVAGRR